MVRMPGRRALRAICAGAVVGWLVVDVRFSGHVHLARLPSKCVGDPSRWKILGGRNRGVCVGHVRRHGDRPCYRHAPGDLASLPSAYNAEAAACHRGRTPDRVVSLPPVRGGTQFRRSPLSVPAQKRLALEFLAELVRSHT